MTIKTDPETQPVRDHRIEPIEYIDEFRDVPAYGIVIWFRQTDVG